jgi:aspartyl-tRNA(Asn)/glutamyl-tRNA(Gln) amidotransferase subunit C
VKPALAQRRDNTRSPRENPPQSLAARRFHALSALKFSMALTSDDIARIANLARLELHDAERARMLGQINGFFDIVERMQAVDTTGVVPLAHPADVVSDVTLRLREDAVSEPNAREANQRSAPAVERGLFLVPKVIE